MGAADDIRDTDQIETWIRRFHPRAQTLLEVACGDGSRAKLLSHRYEIDGIDLDPARLEIARQNNRGGRFFQMDLRDFELERRYDVVTCFASAIGHVQSWEELTGAFLAFSRHLNPGGLILATAADEPITHFQMEAAFQRIGLQVFRDETGVFGRALYIGAAQT